MFLRRPLRSPARLVALLALSVAAACGKDATDPHDDEPQVTQMRLTLGSTSYTFTGAAGENRAVRVPLGATSVSVQWLRADGTVDAHATTPTFSLKVTPGAGITFANTSAQSFTGTLTVAAAVTSVPVQFALLHVAENHEDFGPITVGVSAP